MFNAENGLIHFVFANEDIYIKKGLAMLNRQKNLYYELKEKNYNTVIFVDCNENNYLITCGDAAADQLYEFCKKKGWKDMLAGVFTSQNETPVRNENKSTSYEIPKEQTEKLLGILDRMMSGSHDTAFVVSIDVMTTFDDEPIAQKILKKQSTEKCGNRNLLLIVSDTQLKSSFDKLSNPNGIFQSEVFPEIRDLCKNYTNVRLYDGMKQEMPGRIVYLNEMKRKEISDLVTWSILKLGNKVMERLEKQSEYVDFIWLMNHSVKFANQMRNTDEELKYIFSANNTRRFAILKKELCSESAYEHMDRLIAQIKKSDKNSSLLDLVNADDRFEEYQQYLYQNNSILEAIYKLSIHDQKQNMNEENREKISKIKAKLNTICKQLTKPFVVSSKENHRLVQDFTRYCLNYVQKADALGDYDTMKMGVKALEYAVCKCEKQKLKLDSQEMGAIPKGQTSCMEAYRNVLELLDSVGEQKRKIKSYERRIKTLRIQLQNLQNDIQELERMYPNAPIILEQGGCEMPWFTEYLVAVKEFEAKAQEWKNIENLMKGLKILRNQQKETAATFITKINSIEDADMAVSVSSMMISADELQELAEKTEQMKNANTAFFEQLSTITKMYDKTENEMDVENLVDVKRPVNVENPIDVEKLVDIEDLVDVETELKEDILFEENQYNDLEIDIEAELENYVDHLF